jgi:hypothetical protein
MSLSALVALGGEAEPAAYLNTSYLLNLDATTSALGDNLRGDVRYITSWPDNGWSEYIHVLAT